MRYATLLITLILLGVGAPAVSAQANGGGGSEDEAGCWSCIEGSCYFARYLEGLTVQGVTGCDDIVGGGCWVEAAWCCVGEDCEEDDDGTVIATLLDGSLSPLAVPEEGASNAFTRAGAVLVRACQGDVVARRYGPDRTTQIKTATATLVL